MSPSPDAAGSSEPAARVSPRPRLATRIFGVVLAAAVVFGLLRLLRAGDVRAALASARPSFLAAAFLCYASAFLARGARLRLLLPPGETLPLPRAFAVAGATTFLIQVLPFRSGEPAGWALLKRELGTTWARAGAVAAVVKVVDAATFLLLGLAGAAALSFERERAALGLASSAAVLLGAAGLLLVPRLGAGLVERIRRRLPVGSRRAAIAAELSAGLSVARETPRLYVFAVVSSLVFTALHVATLVLLVRAAGVSVSWDALAFASLTSTFLAAVVPSPAGTFGPMETGFAAGLSAAGITLASGVALAAFLHAATALYAGVFGLPILIRPSAPRP